MGIFARLFAILFALGLSGAGMRASAVAHGFLVKGNNNTVLGNWDVAVNNDTPEIARESGLKHCRAAVGGANASTCSIVEIFDMTCISLAHNGTQLSYAFGYTGDEARQKAYQKCSSTSANLCQTAYTGCDTAAWILCKNGDLSQCRQALDGLYSKIDRDAAEQEIARIRQRVADKERAEQERKNQIRIMTQKEEETKKAESRARAPIMSALQDMATYLPLLLFPIFGLAYGWIAKLDLVHRDVFDTAFNPVTAGVLWGFITALIYDFTTTNIVVGAYARYLSSTEPASVFTLHAIVLGVVYVWYKRLGSYTFGMRYGRLFAAPFWLPGMMMSFVRGLIFLFSRHPAERVISPALRSGKPIDGVKLAASTASNRGGRLPSTFTSWFQKLRGRQIAERAEAAAEVAEADRDVHLAAHRLEIARAEAEAAREALAQVKRDAKERRKKP